MDNNGIIIGLVGGFILSIIASLVSEKVKDWLSKLTLISNRKRRESLVSDLEKMQKFHKNPKSFYYYILRHVFILLLSILLLIFSNICFTAFPTIQEFDSFVNEIFEFWPILSQKSYIFIYAQLLFIILFFFWIIYSDISKIIKEINFLDDYENNISMIEKRIKGLSIPKSS
jgi:hypothetical protein